MPIPVSDLKEAQKPLKERICAWLLRHPGEAFSLEEIISSFTDADIKLIRLVIALAETNSLGGAPQRTYAEYYKPYDDALKALQGEGRVEATEARGSTYYYAPEKKQ